MVLLGFFSLYLYENDIQKGRADIKINLNQVIIHIVLSKILKNNKYDVEIFIGDKGKHGIQKAYIISDKFGNFNNTIRFDKKKLVCDIKYFNSISLVLLKCKKNENCDITGFKGKKFNYKDFDIRNNYEYSRNKKYDSIIDSTSEYCPFSCHFDGLKLIKINDSIFRSMNFTCLKDCLKDYALNSLKFYEFLVFGRCIKGDKCVYILGIPDKFNDYQVIPMANMGAKKFYPIDMKKTPENGDPGFWVIFT